MYFIVRKEVPFPDYAFYFLFWIDYKLDGESMCVILDFISREEQEDCYPQETDGTFERTPISCRIKYM